MWISKMNPRIEEIDAWIHFRNPQIHTSSVDVYSRLQSTADYGAGQNKFKQLGGIF